MEEHGSNEAEATELIDSIGIRGGTGLRELKNLGIVVDAFPLHKVRSFLFRFVLR